MRSATIIGFVGGGGIGFLLIELIRINDMRGVSAVFITIAVIVILLDYFSAASGKGWCNMNRPLPPGRITRNTF